MSDGQGETVDPIDELAPTRDAERAARKPKDPTPTFNVAMVVYIFINLLFALPLVIFPVTFFDAIGLDQAVADELGGLRWVGAMLLAWSISGILVLASPGGRAIFVTTGALQLSFGALAFLYSWSIDEYKWSVWYQAAATAVLVVGSIVLWWARLTGRKLLRKEDVSSAA